MRHRALCLLLCTGALVGAGAAAAAAPVGEAARGATVVSQMVVFRSGRAVAKRVSTRGLLATVGRRRCAVPSRTPLAGLFRSHAARVRLRDFGSCSRHARDAAGLFVAAIGRDRNHGASGWVYKVGNTAATAGAADPDGPFGRGRLRRGQRVTWFYCRNATSCQRTLAARALVEPGRLVSVRVRGYDDSGRGVPIAGASIHVGTLTALTGVDGTATLAVPPGRYSVYASKRGLVRSFVERVAVG